MESQVDIFTRENEDELKELAQALAQSNHAQTVALATGLFVKLCSGSTVLAAATVVLVGNRVGRWFADNPDARLDRAVQEYVRSDRHSDALLQFGQIVQRLLYAAMGALWSALDQQHDHLDARHDVLEDLFEQSLRGQSAMRQQLDRIEASLRAQTDKPITTIFEGPRRVAALPIAHFVGRDAELEALVDLLSLPPTSAVGVVASGIGGIGKSSLVQHFVATRARAMFPAGALWLDAEQLAQELVRAAVLWGWARGREPTPSEANEFLSHRLAGERALVVVDNLKRDAGIADLVPLPGGQCRTLITSRDRRLQTALRGPIQHLDLQAWSTATCRHYLRQAVPRLHSESDQDLDALVELVQRLPLALRMLGVLINSGPGLSANAVMLKVQQSPLQTLDSVVSSTERGIAATFMESYSLLSSTQRQILSALASCARDTSHQYVAGVAHLDPEQARVGLHELHERSLAEFSERSLKPWGLHDLVRAFLRALPEHAITSAAHVDWLDRSFASNDDPLGFPERDRLIDEGIEAITAMLASGDRERSSALGSALVAHLRKRGHFARARELSERVLDVQASDTVAEAFWLRNLALCHYALGNTPQAIACNRRALTIDRNLKNADGEARDLGNLGLCYQALSDIEKAIDCHRDALAINERLASREGQVRDLGNLANCFDMLGDARAAIKAHRRALQECRAIGDLAGEASALGNLGVVFQARGNVRRAIILHARAVEIDRRIGSLAGESSSLTNLGICYGRLGEFEMAIATLTAALDIDGKLGRSRGVAVQMGSIGLCFQQLGNLPKAVEYHLKALQLDEQLGRQDGQANHLGNLALCYQTVGDLSAALRCHERALEIDVRIGRREGEVGHLYDIGVLLRRVGQSSQAQVLLERAMRLLKSMNVPEHHPRLQSVRRALSS